MDIERLKTEAKILLEKNKVAASGSAAALADPEALARLTRARYQYMLALLCDRGLIQCPEDVVPTLVALLGVCGAISVNTDLQFSEMLSIIEKGQDDVFAAVAEEAFYSNLKPAGSA